MKICKKCSEPFKSYAYIDGFRKTLSSRKNCLKCAPYGSKIGQNFIDRRSWTDDQLKEAVATSQSFTDIIKKVGLIARGGNWKTIKKHIERLKLDISHLDGKQVAIQKMNASSVKTDEEIFCLNSKVARTTLVKRTKQLNFMSYDCSNPKCNEITVINNIAYRLGEEITLHLDHINGVNNDNRQENLRWLCGSCHTQTKTYAGKKAKHRSDLIVNREIKRTKFIQLSKRKVNHEEVRDYYKGTTNYSATSRKFGISANAVKKIILNEKIDNLLLNNKPDESSVILEKNPSSPDLNED